MSWLGRRRDTNSGQYRRLILGPIERTRRPVSRVLYPPARPAGDGHSSGTSVAGRLVRPTRAAGAVAHPRAAPEGAGAAAPIWSCSRWGLPCRPCRQGRGALLPHPFTLTAWDPAFAWDAGPRAVCFLWHFPWGRPRRALPGTALPWSPDFPPARERNPRASDRPAVWSDSGGKRCAPVAQARGGLSHAVPWDFMGRLLRLSATLASPSPPRGRRGSGRGGLHAKCPWHHLPYPLLPRGGGGLGKRRRG